MRVEAEVHGERPIYRWREVMSLVRYFSSTLYYSCMRHIFSLHMSFVLRWWFIMRSHVCLLASGELPQSTALAVAR